MNLLKHHAMQIRDSDVPVAHGALRTQPGLDNNFQLRTNLRPEAGPRYSDRVTLPASFKPELPCVGGSQPDLLPIPKQFEFPKADRDRLIRNMIPMGLPICELHQVSIALAKPNL